VSNKCVRTTISIPHELKKRMDRVKEPVNWSALACQAFESKLYEIQKLKEIRTMTNVIERLRASKRETESADFESGLTAGREWGMKSAEFKELERLSDFCRESKGGVEGWLELFDITHTNAASLAERVCSVVQGDDECACSDVDEFWEDIASETDREPAEWLRGFTEGAVAVFREVEDQL